MQVQRIRKQPGGDWNAFGMFARQRVSVMTSRVQYGHRIDGMERTILVEKGLYKEIIEKKVDENGKTRTGRKYAPIDDSEETARRIAEERERIYKLPSYILMSKYFNQLKQFEKGMEKEAIDLVKDYKVTQFCEQVKGLGYISALTFMGYYNPLHTETPSDWMSFLGWTPGSRLKRGEQGHSNPLAKGRTFMCCSGVILHTDPYYKPLYDEKKRYLSERPDFVYERDELERKGVKAHINRLGYEFIIKLILNHAFTLMYEDYWGIPFYMSDEYHRVRHRNHIPVPTQINPDKWARVHEIARIVDDRMLVDARAKWEEYKPYQSWKDKESEPVRQWKDWLAHAPLEVYMQGLETI